MIINDPDGFSKRNINLMCVEKVCLAEHTMGQSKKAVSDTVTLEN